MNIYIYIYIYTVTIYRFLHFQMYHIPFAGQAQPPERAVRRPGPHRGGLIYLSIYLYVCIYIYIYLSIDPKYIDMNIIMKDDNIKDHLMRY